MKYENILAFGSMFPNGNVFSKFETKGLITYEVTDGYRVSHFGNRIHSITRHRGDDTKFFVQYHDRTLGGNECSIDTNILLYVELVKLEHYGTY